MPVYGRVNGSFDGNVPVPGSTEATWNGQDCFSVAMACETYVPFFPRTRFVLLFRVIPRVSFVNWRHF